MMKKKFLGLLLSLVMVAYSSNIIRDESMDIN